MTSFRGAVNETTSTFGQFFGVSKTLVEDRNKIFVPSMMQNLTKQISKIEKILGKDHESEVSYAVNNSLSLADFEILKLKLFCFDQKFNQYCDFKGSFKF